VWKAEAEIEIETIPLW